MDIRLVERSKATHHVRVRNQCSGLNYDLFQNHLRDNPFCLCLLEPEDAEHFFFRCHFFGRQRLKLFNSSRNFYPLDINMLLCGRPDLRVCDSSKIFRAAQGYIRDTGRFKQRTVSHTI